jgi:hypothetical protein
LNILNNYADEWDNLQWQAQECTKKDEINEWENVIINEINLDASNPKKKGYKYQKKLNYTI